LHSPGGPAGSAGQQWFAWSGDEPVTHSLLASKLSCASYRFGLSTRRFLRWLFVEPSSLHFPEHALALHLLFQDPKGLIDIVIAHKDLQSLTPMGSKFDEGRCCN
jgi:hypothetical protein